MLYSLLHDLLPNKSTTNRKQAEFRLYELFHCSELTVLHFYLHQCIQFNSHVYVIHYDLKVFNAICAI